jgi:hypothetical protein
MEGPTKVNITAVEIIPLSGTEKCIVRVSEKKNKKLNGYITTNGDITYDTFKPGHYFSNSKLNKLITFENQEKAAEVVRNCWYRQTKLEVITPLPDSMWLVIVECRYEVIHVSVNGDGFYIPGQEPCWDLSHVSEWIKEIVPAEWDPPV